MSKDNNEDKLKKLMKIDYTYPSPKEKDFQKKIYTKREFYAHKIPGRSELKNYQDIKEYRDKICSRNFKLHEHQSFLSNFINPDTPFRGTLIFHGTGTGKCVHADTCINIYNKKMKAIDIWNIYNNNIIKIDSEGGEWSKPTFDLEVDSYDYNNKQMKKRKIVNLYREKVNTILRTIKLENGEIINITMPHKLLTTNGWMNIFKLGDKIGIFKDDIVKYIEITEISYFEINDYVYDFEIEEFHNYVGNNIICHNTCAGIAIAERFKPMVKKYNTKIHVLVSGPLIKENWKNELLKCTGETYLKKQDTSFHISAAEKNKEKKNAMNIALQYYRFMSNRSFYKKVLGEKIVEKTRTKDNKIKVTYRKTKEGVFERDVALDRIYNLNNTLIIIDEAHGLTGNMYGEALMKIIKNSTNLKIILLTATPMKNLADDIVELLNFIRPFDSPILRDKIFTSHKNHLMNFKPGGEDYLRNMARGYISFLRGADPLTFAKRVEKGVIPKGLLFTKVIQCKMLELQKNTYNEAIQLEGDTLDRKSEAVANFVFPGLSPDKKQIQGYYGREGINILKNQLKTNYELLNKKIATDVLKLTNLDDDIQGDFIHLSDGGKTISGKILNMKYLKFFSVKFYKAIKKINRLVWSKKGARTSFVYSNLVKVGIELFEEILIQNGYLEYDDNPANYKITNNTVCYFCGHTHKQHLEDDLIDPAQKNDLTRMSESSTEYNKTKNLGKEPPFHNFYPATFISITGSTSEETDDVIPEDKQKILDNVFSSIDNKEGKYIKLVLGSKVMNEGISLKNVAEVHILDVYFNLGRVDQVIGRGIRHCSHYEIINDENRYPAVNVYKYAVHLEKSLSTEEELYKKAELKYVLIKKVERILKEIAIDCPLNRNGNIFPEELKEFHNCIEPGNKITPGHKMCPGRCDYTNCDFHCNDNKLNDLYWDPIDKIYKNVQKKDIDYSTFTRPLARNEIEAVKVKIKDMYKIRHVYTLDEILNYIKDTYDTEKRNLFDEFFCFKALDELIPISENDFNNFRDTIFDKLNKPGYLIYIDKYYIFQPFDENEDVPMYYRSNFDQVIQNPLSLFNYIKNNYDLNNNQDITSTDKIKKDNLNYDFDSVMEYYDNRPEFKYVGIIDKESLRKKNRRTDELNDIFKIREKRDKILEKKRGTGIPSIRGAVCSTSKDKNYLINIAKSLNIELNKNNQKTRGHLCNVIKDKLLLLEKYSTNKNKNKMTYIMIPKNHPVYIFPYNLEDRAKYILDSIKDKIKFPLDIDVKKNKLSLDNIQDSCKYTISIANSSKIDDFKTFFTNLGASLKNNKWIFNLE